MTDDAPCRTPCHHPRRDGRGGIYDQLGGGFRPLFDRRRAWPVPHFEKMLYDNAQLVDLLTKLVWNGAKAPHLQRIDETLDWVSREMLTPGGGFRRASTPTASTRKVNSTSGRRPRSMRSSANNAALFKGCYDVTPEGNWEEKTILNRSKAPELADDETERVLAFCRSLLFRVREDRVRPGWDDKVLADWNGLMIAAMANAGLVFERLGWVELARDAFDFVRRDMVRPDGRLLHSWRSGSARHPASVDDYANLCRAALALHEATGGASFLTQARDWVAILDRYFWDEAAGGYFFAANDTEGLIARAKTAADAAVPAGNGTVVGVLTRLAILTGVDAYRRRAEAIVETFSGEVARNFFPLATLLNNAELLDKPLQIVVVGEDNDPALQALGRAVYRLSLPNRVVLTLPPDRALPRQITRRPAKVSSPENPQLMSATARSARCRYPTPRVCSKLSPECASVPLCSTDQQLGEVSPPHRHSFEANVFRPPKLQHTVERRDGDGHLGRLPPFGPRAQCGADHSLVAGPISASIKARQL